MRDSQAGRPRLCVVGPMVGEGSNLTKTQGEILGDLLAGAGYDVLKASFKTSRWGRLFDITATVFRAQRKYDVLLVQVYGGPSFIVEDFVSLVAGALGKRQIFHVHGGAMPEFMDRFPRWTRRVLRRADALVVPSGYLQRSLEKRGQDARVIPNILGPQPYPYRLRRALSPRFLWMRAFHRIYNPDMAVEAFAAIRRRRPDATLVMAGHDQGEAPRIIEMVEHLGLGASVTFPGYLDEAAKRFEGERADIFLNTNRIDNAPVSLLEACAMGLPVISTNVGGIADLLQDGRTGLLVPDGDHEAMAEAAERLLQDPGLAEMLSREGRALALQNSCEDIISRWGSLINNLGSLERGQ